MKKSEEVINKQVYFFYKKDKINRVEIEDRFRSFFFYPRLFKLKLHPGSFFLYLFWFVFSFGRYRIFYIVDEKSGVIAHYSNILPKIFKYAFMNKDDWYIANCYTDSKFRGCRLYSFALYDIANKMKGTNIWGGTRDNNIPSIKGLDRAGYKKVSRGYKTNFFGIYRLYE